MLPLTQPSNGTQFEEMMRIVDAYLRESGVPPHARPIRGWLEISGSLKLHLRMFPERDRAPVEGRYDGDDMTIRIFQWFEDQYGDKLKISFGPGRVFILVRHDPWVIQLPRIYGSAQVIASATVPSSKPEEYLRRREIPRLNVVDSIEGMTEAMKISLKSHELRAIYDQWRLGFEALSALEAIAQTPMVREVQSDIEAAVQHALSRPPHHGQCKWSCLQAAEKALKIFLTATGNQFPKTHELHRLVPLAERAGMPTIERAVVDAVQCSPAIRYGDEPTTAFQALGAHIASLRIARHVGLCM